jgi:hypothetical protein
MSPSLARILLKQDVVFADGTKALDEDNWNNDIKKPQWPCQRIQLLMIIGMVIRRNIQR